MKRNIYLDMVSDQEALDTLLENLKKDPSSEMIDVKDSLGRRASQPVYASLSNPSFNSSAMDGIAVRADDTAGASQARPLLLEEGSYLPVNTGDPLPQDYDAVIMVEDIEEAEGGVLIRSSVPLFNHVRTIGEDIVSGEMIVPTNQIIRPFDISALVAAGISQVPVCTRPKVSIIPTGSEIVEEGSQPKHGQILDSNSWMIKARLEEIGAQARVYPIVKDDLASITDLASQALDQSDMVLIIAGSSAGSKDFTRQVIDQLGQVLVHGINIKPGKPTILAASPDGKAIIGLPGYPVSCWLALEKYVVPALAHRSPAIQARYGGTVPARAARRMNSSIKYKEFVRVKLGRVKGRLVASPLDRGAGSTMSLVRADGFAIIPASSEGLEAGDEVQVQLLRPLDEIEKSLVVSGSHDLIIDELADELRKRGSTYSISSSHIGSLSGIMALARGECHLAPSHLMDEETGTYNDSFVKEIFPEDEMAIVTGLGRTQGLIVKKGNPKNIQSLADLPGKNFINRQRGSGTRVFTDYLLKKEGIDPASIKGYDVEKSSHMDIAASVSQNADVGMGIYSATKALDLDFIPLGNEDYEFVLYKEDLDLPMVQDFLEVLTSQAFKDRVQALGGYSLKKTGQIRYI